jgi:alginate O-acetyltransferase complex protein AlgI
MSFTSWQFALFVVIVFVIYYLPRCHNLQVQILIVASLFFYGYDRLDLLGLLALAVLGTYAFLILSLRNRRLWLPIGIAFNLALLGFFKYKFLFIDPSGLPTHGGLFNFLLKLPLPIGISFFVFHNISLLVDLSRRASGPRLSEVFLYIIFFPQLVSGPITLARNFLPQIVPKSIGDVPLLEATKWIIVGNDARAVEEHGALASPGPGCAFARPRLGPGR